MGASIGVDQAVHAEVAVVGVVPEVTAVGEVGIGDAILTDGGGVVDELPDTAAHEAILGVDHIPILLQTAGAVAHGVGVLAEEQGLGVDMAVKVGGADIVGGGVHTALHVDEIVLQSIPDLLVGLALHVPPQTVGGAAGCVLAMDQALGVAGMEVLAHFALVLAHARLVAQGPHEHAGVVLVPLEHPLHAIQVGGGPRVAVGELVPVAHHGHTVGLDVGLVDDVEAVLIAQGGEAGIIGVVAGADAVDIVPLHDHEVADHVLHGGGGAENGVAVVAVDALELDLLAVEVQHAVPDLDGTEAHLQGNRLAAAGNEEGVEVGLLVAPQLGGVHKEVNGSLPLDEEASRLDLHPVGAQELVLHQALPIQGDLGGAEAAGVGLVDGGAGVDIHDMDGIAQEKEDLAEDARPAVFVLILQIGAVAPLQNEDLDEVLALVQILADLKLRGHMADLAVAHELPVDEEVEAGVHALEVEVERLVLQHGGVELDGTAVEAAGVIVGDEGRVYRDGVGHVDVVGSIVAPTQHGLPGAGDVDLLAVRNEALGGEVGEVA